MFSGIVKIADIDDYITPSQNCKIVFITLGVKPISEKQEDKQINKPKEKKAKITIGDIDNLEYSEPDLIKIKNKDSKTAKVSLNDCLACSGCVTTAETLLIEAQSVDEFIKNSLDNDKVSIVCISPQSLLSISKYYNNDIETTLNKLTNCFNKLNVKHIFNYEYFVQYVLEQAYQEYKRRVLIKKEQYIICSECPGWVCYAEKKLGNWVIPYLSNLKSPQQVMGHVLKAIYKNYYNKDIYLTCIMPCFDKKLEASREGHRTNNNETEVDTVISTVEIPELLDKLNIDFTKIDCNQEDLQILTIAEDLLKLNNKESINYVKDKNYILNNFTVPINFTSNGYGEYIIKRYINEYKIFDYRIERTILKNSDFKIINLYASDNNLLLSFALVYGFRNIQNIIRNKTKIKYSYLEVMACPGGCLNGGGQMRPTNEKTTSRDILKQIEEQILFTQKQNEKDQPLNITEEYKLFEQILYEYKDLISQDFMITHFKAVEDNIGPVLKW